MAKQRICPKCGKTTRTAGPFCPMCKKKLPPLPPLETGSDLPSDEKPKKLTMFFEGLKKKFKNKKGNEQTMENNQPKKRRGLKILLAVAIIVALGGIGFLAIQTINANQLISQAAKSLTSDSMSPAATTTPPATAESVTPVASPAPSPSPSSTPDQSQTTEVSVVKGKIFVEGKEVGTIFDNRLTITCGEILYPETTVGDYSAEQLKKIASTWIKFQIEPNGMLPMVFAGGLKTESTSNNEGVVAYIGSKNQTIEIRNGELVLWNNMDDLHADITNRMADEIQNGNQDIHTKLAFKACSPEVAGYFPAELLKSNKIKTITFAAQ